MKLLSFSLTLFAFVAASIRCFANGEEDIQDSAFDVRSKESPAIFNPFAQPYQFIAGKRHFDFRLPASTDYCYVVIRVQSPVQVNLFFKVKWLGCV